MKTKALLPLLLLCGCTRSSDPRLYTLTATRGSASYPAASVIEVQRPTIAGYLDRREIVRAVISERLDTASGANWAEPLDAMFGRVLAADLAQRMPQSSVFTDLNTLGAVPNVVVVIEVQRFERGDDGLVLRALLGLRRADANVPTALSTIELKDANASTSTDGQVAAMNALLGQLSDRVAALIAQ